MPSNVLYNDIDLIGLLPAYFKVIKDFKELMGTEQIEFNLFWDYMTRVWNNLFIQTADSDTLKYHEDLLGIIPEEGDSLAVRRWRILNYYRRRSPFTLGSLYILLNESVGLGNWEVEVHYDTYMVDILLRVDDITLYRELIRTLILSLPAHLQQNYSQSTEGTSTAFISYGATISLGRIYSLD